MNAGADAGPGAVWLLPSVHLLIRYRGAILIEEDMGMARRFRLLPGIVGIALVFALLAACGGAGAGGSTAPGGAGEPSGLGESFTLPAGSIADFPGGFGQAQVELKDLKGSTLHTYGPVSISGGTFPGLDITAPPDDDLRPWTEIKAMIEAQIALFYSTGDIDLSVTDNDFMGQLILGLYLEGGNGWAAEPYMFRGDKTSDELVLWAYADRDATVTGTGSHTYGTDNLTFIIDVEVNVSLVSGWNRVSAYTSLLIVDLGDGQLEYQVDVDIVSGPAPQDITWYFDDDPPS
jgi:hypothetical protein